MDKDYWSVKPWKNVPIRWREVIAPNWEDSDRDKLIQKWKENQTNPAIIPGEKNLFRALELCHPEEVKVLILGQDPYPNRYHANGLAFSVFADVHPLPASLRNLFKEMQRDFPTFSPSSGDLTSWAKQGVLLLNTTLSTEHGKAAAHAHWGWSQFTLALLKGLAHTPNPKIGLFWGKHAEKLGAVWEKKHKALYTSHPSPLSVRKGFEGCGHFLAVNEYLRSKGLSEIQW